MGKSYKKYPILRQEKENYHYLNRQLRRDKLRDVPNGAAYRKLRPKWSEWSYPWTKEQAIQEYNHYEHIRERYETLEDWLNYWKSCVVRK